jgi:hypothetical protein
VPDRIAAQHSEIARRYKRRRKAPARTVSTVRIQELTRLFRARHGYQLPDSALGRDHAAIMCHHLAEAADDPRKRINDWLGLWCPWLTIGEAKAMRDECLTQPQRWKAKRLGFRLRLVDMDRQALGIRTIAPCDISPAEMLERRKAKARVRAAKARARKRKRTRAEYLANCQGKPWIATGISRSAWYRQRKVGQV